MSGIESEVSQAEAEKIDAQGSWETVKGKTKHDEGQLRPQWAKGGKSFPTPKPTSKPIQDEPKIEKQEVSEKENMEKVDWPKRVKKSYSAPKTKGFFFFFCGVFVILNAI